MDDKTMNDTSALVDFLKNSKRSSQDLMCFKNKLSLHDINWTFKIKCKGLDHKYYLEYESYKKAKGIIINTVSNNDNKITILEFPSPVFRYYQYIDIDDFTTEQSAKEYVEIIIDKTFKFCKQQYDVPDIENFNEVNVYRRKDKNVAMVIYKYLLVNNDIKSKIDFHHGTITKCSFKHVIIPYTMFGDIYLEGWFNNLRDIESEDLATWIENAFVRLRLGFCAINGYNGLEDYEYLKYPFYNDRITLLYKTSKEKFMGDDSIIDHINHILPYESKYEFYKFMSPLKNTHMRAFLVKRGLRYTRNMKFQVKYQPFHDPKIVKIEITKEGILNIIVPEKIDNVGKIDSALLHSHSITRFEKELGRKLKNGDQVKKTFAYIRKMIKNDLKKNKNCQEEKKIN